MIGRKPIEDQVFYDFVQPFIFLGIILQLKVLLFKNICQKTTESFTDDYISNAEKVTNEVEIPYTYKDGIYSAEYDTEEFVNALTGNLVTAYQKLMQDVQKELSEETGDEKNN